MSKVIVYSKNNCTFCTKAKNLLKSVGLEYTEKKMEDFKDVNEMFDDIGKPVRSMPQIKINDELIGGYNQLIEHFVNEGKVDYQGNIKK